MPMTTTNYAPISVPRSDVIADLLSRLSDGDPVAWDEILCRYGKLVTATVRSFRLQNADALDAVQMTWLRLVENAHRVQSPERLGGWLATTARRECLHILRQTKCAPNPIDVAEPSMGPEQRVIDVDTARTLWNLVEELSPRQRTLLRALFTDHPRPYTEIFRTTGIPPGAIGPTRARALAQLRRRLEQRQPIAWIPGNSTFVARKRRPESVATGPSHDRPRAIRVVDRATGAEPRDLADQRAGAGGTRRDRSLARGLGERAVPNEYRTQDGFAGYGFSIEFQSGRRLVYVVFDLLHE
jgi:RNA polymerase sigma factor (sigma-70 family)